MLSLFSDGVLSMINGILIMLSIMCSSVPLAVSYFKHRRKKTRFVLSENIPLCIATLFLMIGCLTRVSFLDLLPGGLNQDEASSGYDAFSIMTYGIDRNGMSYPVHLIAWGSGQNAAYSYLCIPFLKIMSNTEIALRLPMALSSCLSLFVFYFVIKSVLDEKTATLSLAFLAINPWHIMKSRWALESNLFPEMVFLAVLLLLVSVQKRNYIFFYLSAILFALSSYSYGTSYFFLFFFVIFFLAYLLLKKVFKWYHLLLYLLTIGVLCIPIILFLYINIFDKETMHILFFDIPKLKVDRFHSVTSIFSKNFMTDGMKNLKNGLTLLVTQNDGLPWNSIPAFGALYLFTIPFSMLGLFKGFTRSYKDRMLTGIDRKIIAKETYAFIVKDWLIVSLMMMFILSSNINRINIIWFPLILLAIDGISLFISLFDKKEKAKLIVKSSLSTLYIASFVSFFSYYSIYWNKNRIEPNFFYSFKEALLYSESIEHETTYISSHANYTLVLYYTKYNTRDYVDSVVFTNPGSAFENVKSFSGYVFSLPSKLEKGNTYIIYNSDNTYSEDKLSKYHVEHFQYYSVVDTTKEIQS